MCGRNIRSISRVSYSVHCSLRGLSILCALFLFGMLMPPMLNAQSSLPPLPTNTSLTLPRLRQMSAMLVQRLNSRLAESEQLSAELAQLKDKAKSLQTELEATSTSLDKSTQDYSRLNADFDAYVAKSNDNIKAVEKERDAAIVVAKINSLRFKLTLGVGAGIGVYELGHHDWNLGFIHFKKIW
jgi:septal ring factor EnvC (AmiA/AmiB activator)